MEQEQSVLSLYTDGPIGMDHPVFAMSMEARRLATWAAQEGLTLQQTLEQVRAQLTGLFGEVLQPLADATATTAWLEVAGSEGGDRG
jgi:hypothetical protein